MKQLIMLSIASLLWACGTSKKAISTPETESTGVSVPMTDTVPDVPEEVEIPMEETEAPKEEYEIPVDDQTEMEEAENTSEEIVEEEIEIALETFDHTGLNFLLRNYVSDDGRVNYAKFKQDRNLLSIYIESLGENMPTDSWSKEDKLAYWMNAYNAMTVDLIVRNYPLASIKDIDKPWDQRLWKLGAKWYNLDEIEHQILRKMDDPRIHFGINCASFSCPTLLNEAFTAEKVNAQLDALAIKFINDPKRNTITSEKIVISKIFSWFSKDFKKDGSLIDYLNLYSEVKINDKARKSFMTYNWNLNK